MIKLFIKKYKESLLKIDKFVAFALLSKLS